VFAAEIAGGGQQVSKYKVEAFLLVRSHLTPSWTAVGSKGSTAN
jgi:hypothetical protein